MVEKSSLLDVKGISMHFPIKGGLLRRTTGKVYAVNDVNFSLEEGETLGIVGESGCGKSTLGRTLMRIYKPTAGKVIFKGSDVTELSNKGLLSYRQKAQMVFQDPYTSLNPRMTIYKTLEEPLILHHSEKSKQQIQSEIEDLIRTVGLRVSDLHKFPHEFSGGQRQRIGIARALALNPELIICDEAVSALDVSIQSQILNLLVKLQEERNLTYLFISHDLTVVRYISDRVAVMYLGRIVEIARSEDIYKNPLHPYTKALLSAVPLPDPDVQISPDILEGDVPSPTNPPTGCPFHTRCKFVEARCRNELPQLTNSHQEKHQVACHFYQSIQKKESTQ